MYTIQGTLTYKSRHKNHVATLSSNNESVDVLCRNTLLDPLKDELEKVQEAEFGSVLTFTKVSFNSEKKGQYWLS